MMKGRDGGDGSNDISRYLYSALVYGRKDGNGNAGEGNYSVWYY